MTRLAVRQRSTGRLMIFGFLSPTLAILLFMVAYPIFSLIYYSFFNFSALRPAAGMKPVGFGNYKFLLSDPDLWQRFIFTGKFVFLCVTLQMLIGIFVGYQLQKNFRGRDLIFTALMMPMMLSPVVVGFLWRYMFNSEWGMINYLLTVVGLPKIDWLGQTTAALWAAAAADTWMWTPFIILLATAAFRGIPETINEAAEVDGASPAYRFFRITLPMSAPVLFIALILRLIDSFKQYDLFFALTGGGPGSSTETVSFAVAKTAFSYFYTGEASALAVVLLVIIIGLSMILVRHLNKMGERF
ncbi:multiple sugar transport system permease protein [Pararhizobium capsulatum DSM 1112]|uniref:Multiple sugar transport system permease protein n=1 Tax=Pararhizobium capsulatum DSM 1112 TaxID=1121113 RepID=A0ABU0C2F5_9HYPH|nr:sugar ABC transporter permease [Pararhizobium capsulatum]MDQ0324129.1 multiple sugar transport system permease protein [Pararhizobium capsulatum DSM 1112]